MDETPPPLDSSPSKKKDAKRKPSISLKRRTSTTPAHGTPLTLPEIDVDESREDDKIAEAQVRDGLLQPSFL